jgi:hypothetical protein
LASSSRRGSSRLVAAVATTLLAASSPAAGPYWNTFPRGPEAAVRNVRPQRTVALEPQSFPLYYPRPAHRSAAVAAESDQDQKLLREFLDLHSSMNYEGAASTAKRLVILSPRRPEAHYNAACALARAYKLDAAFESLCRAVDCGWDDPVHMTLDPDLRVLRADPRFARLLETITVRDATNPPQSLSKSPRRLQPATAAPGCVAPPQVSLP